MGLASSLRIKPALFWCVLIAMVTLVPEMVLRIAYGLKAGSDRESKRFSERLGWEIEAYQDILRQSVYTGEVIRFSTVRDGFRIFGDLDTSKKKIFVIGDSFTEARNTDDEKTYYAYLKSRHENIEIFAFGCGGYGSLQEYMILDQYIDIIRPDIILWQFSGNDIINNDHELESLSLINNNHMTRPYWVGGHIEWRYPENVPPWTYRMLNSSYLVRFLRVKLNVLKAELSGDTIEEFLDKEGNLFRRTVETTTAIMRLVKERARDIPVVAFNAIEDDWIHDATFEGIALGQGMKFIPGVHQKVQEAKKRGVNVEESPGDVHWNANGHAIAGRRILDFLIEEGYV